MIKDWVDLQLTYENACHAMQTAVAFEMALPERKSATEPKHLRVGINSAMSDHSALAYLLIKKGVITEEEYREELRLAMNNEVARYMSAYPKITFR
jgi:hypothetical protein